MTLNNNSSVFKVLKIVGQDIVDEVTDAIEANDLVASKGLLQGFDFGIKILGDKYIIRWDWSGNPKTEKYVKYVIEGRNPGKRPPILAIMTWIRDKGLSATQTQKSKKILKSLKSKRIKKGFKQLSKEKAVKSFAFAIATNIAKKGTIKRFGYKGKNFLKPVQNGLAKRISQRLTEAFKKDFLGEIKIIAKEL